MGEMNSRSPFCQGDCRFTGTVPTTDDENIPIPVSPRVMADVTDMVMVLTWNFQTAVFTVAPECKNNAVCANRFPMTPIQLKAIALPLNRIENRLLRFQIPIQCLLLKRFQQPFTTESRLRRKFEGWIGENAPEGR